MNEKEPVRRRIIELDLLRGHFIVIIILDHLDFYPSPLSFLSGKGVLWVTAAEGFFLISGMLIGYIRAYKGQNTSLRDTSWMLISRAAKLYLWGVAISLAIIGYTLAIGPNDRLPALPPEDQMATPLLLLKYILNMQAFNDWIFFLRMYAVMLAFTPVFLWLVRRRLVYLAGAISIAIYALSFLQPIPDAELQWQLLFFGSAIIGYTFEDMRRWAAAHTAWRTTIIVVLIALTALSITASALIVNAPDVFEHLGQWDLYERLEATTAHLFSNSPMMPARMALSFLWFCGFLALFHVLRDWIGRWLGWLLMPFGTFSLTAYCLQALVLPIVVTFLGPTENVWLNGLLGALVVLLIWYLLRLRIVRSILPQ